MIVKDIKEIIKDLPDDMPVQLVDLSTDDDYKSIYGLTNESLSIGDFDEKEGKLMAITFWNKK